MNSVTGTGRTVTAGMGDAGMGLRRTAAGMPETGTEFWRLRADRHLPILRHRQIRRMSQIAQGWGVAYMQQMGQCRPGTFQQGAGCSPSGSFWHSLAVYLVHQPVLLACCGWCCGSNMDDRIMTMRYALLAVLAVLTALILAGCGGGTSTQGVGSGPVVPPMTQADRMVGAHIRTRNRTIGIGPAFLHESPAADDLPTLTPVNGGEIRSGTWRGTADGSASATELLRFLQAFQDQANAEGGDDIIIARPGGPKTLRIGTGIRRNERETVDDAIRILNTALPWGRRLRLGSPVALAATDAGIPDDEIHLHFTNGKAGWPPPNAGDEPWNDATLGIGGTSVDRDTRRPLGGNAYIDRTHPAFINGRADLRTTVLHELLHASGIVAHVDPDQYPTSILQPRYDPAVDPDLYVTLDGELLRASAHLPVGTRVRDLTVTDFGAWENTGFHLLVWSPLGDTDVLRGGVIWRNGLPTPWVYGPEPDRTLAHLGTTATWDGTLLGFVRGDGRTVRGDAAITANLDRSDGRAAFTALESWPHRRHPGDPGSGTRWGDGDLAYTLTLWEDGTRSGFDAAFATDDDPGVVTGIFVGVAHEGAAGVLEHPDLAAAFGGVRE